MDIDEPGSTGGRMTRGASGSYRHWQNFRFTAEVVASTGKPAIEAATSLEDFANGSKSSPCASVATVLTWNQLSVMRHPSVSYLALRQTRPTDSPEAQQVRTLPLQARIPPTAPMVRMALPSQSQTTSRAPSLPRPLNPSQRLLATPNISGH